MTRINGNIPPQKLIDQHLVAEYREMVRIPNAVRSDYAKARKALVKAPRTFKLGTGHVVFFYDKIKFLHERYLAVCDEMRERNIAVNMPDSMFLNISDEFYKDAPAASMIGSTELLNERILERVSTMKKEPKYRGETISVEDYKLILLS